MSLPVFLHPDLHSSRSGDRVALSGPECRHAVAVKRIAVGERIALVDVAGFRAEVVVTAVSGKDFLEATVATVGQVPEPSPRVVVVQAIPKSERAELAVDLATQAGADEIIVWSAARCVARWDAKKIPKALAKLQSAATAAAKQSRRARVPQVRGPLSTAEVAELLAGQQAYVLHEAAAVSIKEVALDAETVYLVIGPEGGIGGEELDALGAQAVRLGPEVLRTASAAMVALAAIGVRTERW